MSKMTDAEWCVAFCVEKNRLLQEAVALRIGGAEWRVKFLLPWDKREIKKMAPDALHDFRIEVRRMSKERDPSFYYTDTDLCLWCFVYGFDCTECSYGRRHRRCTRRQSDYSTYANIFGRSIGLIGVIGKDLMKWVRKNR